MYEMKINNAFYIKLGREAVRAIECMGKGIIHISWNAIQNIDNLNNANWVTSGWASYDYLRVMILFQILYCLQFKFYSSVKRIYFLFF
jgi:hypothetical protein